MDGKLNGPQLVIYTDGDYEIDMYEDDKFVGHSKVFNTNGTRK